jgi:hypothetical protein
VQIASDPDLAKPDRRVQAFQIIVAEAAGVHDNRLVADRLGLEPTFLGAVDDDAGVLLLDLLPAATQARVYCLTDFLRQLLINDILDETGAYRVIATPASPASAAGGTC